jgi:hypothetical protein
MPVGDKFDKYTLFIQKHIKELYPDESKVELVICDDKDISLGEKYNKAVKLSKGEKIILIHNDMVLKPGFIELMDKYITSNKIVTYTRIEPPIYPDEYPGKIIQNFGYDLEDFDYNAFKNFEINNEVIKGGSQIFFGCLKKDYIGFDGETFKMFCEDDDIHLRYDLGSFERIICGAQVYHLVSKTSRKGDYQPIEHNSNINFIRKWGFRKSQYNKKYDIGIKIKGGTSSLLEFLEPWCSNILLDDEMQVITSHYIDKEQKNTPFNLSKKILSTPFQSLENEIIIEIDQKTFNQQDYLYLQQISDIIYDNGELGYFELGNLKITINSMNEYQKNLIFIENP